MVRWVKACRLAELVEGEPRGVKLDGVSVALFRVGEACHAVHDICTHEYALLSNGWQEGDVVECPLHQARFNVVTGKCLALPAERDLAVFAVRIEGEDVLVGVPEGRSDADLAGGAG
jgi:nitrite reductase/ring-hydroxylating ferredoxin subunit